MFSRIPSSAIAPKTSQYWVVGISLILLFSVGLVLSYTEDEINISTRETVVVLPAVSVERVIAGEERAYVEAYAEVKPRWSINLKSEVSGVVTEVYPLAMAGNRVEKGAALFAIDDSRYLAELAEAKQALYETQLAVERAEYTHQVARKQYRQSGKPPPNEFSVHLPQLTIARAAQEASKARVVLAKRLLDQTVIKAPFSAYLLDRYVSPGQLVMAGESTARLINDEAFDVSVNLSRTAWQLLELPLSGQRVELLNERDEPLGHAWIREGGGYLEQKTRHFSVYLDLSPEEAQVLVGEFIRVRIQGKSIANSFNIAASSVTEDGFFWRVNEDDQLVKETAEIIFRRGERVVVAAPEAVARWRIVTTPLSSYLPGQWVQPLVKGA